MEDKLKTRLGEKNYQKLIGIDNPELHQFIAKYVELCNPDKVFVCTDSPEDVQYVRQEAIRAGEEMELAIAGHTVHFDGYYDQARDKKNTKFLLPPGADLGANLNAMNREEGLKEIHDILKDIMRGHQLFVRFFCLGPLKSQFSIPAVQLTDSGYVAHSEDLLYRQGYEEFVRLGGAAQFFKFVHSAGKLDERMTSKNIDKRRVYIDLEDETVYSVNTQYGGNTIGLKKLAMRTAINRASKEGWLNEHMFIMAVRGPSGRKTYFTGAFPSLCGKTSTSMLPGESIIGDDITYIRNKEGVLRAVNPENGIFGIIQGVNPEDDHLIWKALHSPGEIIFSNVLVTEEESVFWIGKAGEEPKKGFHHSGEWTLGKRDAEGIEISLSHPNARFTLDLKLLENRDSELDNPEGVVIGGIIYGGRDSDTKVPVEESFDWAHGVITMGAALESETTAATLGKEGVRKINPMSNLDFLSIPIGKYIANHLNFGRGLKNPPPIFSVNYFLKNANGNFTNDKTDKAVWLKWMELRSHHEVEVIKTPTGLIPEYEGLKRLFKEVLDKDYVEKDYNEQFTVRITENLAKIERVMVFYRTEVPDTPEILFTILEEQRQRLKIAREKYGDYILPKSFLSDNGGTL
uniref:Phosphoenolpyruvate carboxykinase [GTP] n=1 Tax=Candidatus Methanophagaceae archaeon ANME-1 ERB6 TaxID=2759912 RepID=A0A7G9YST7_9EURY|nr:phosphoenolpyruvate carboxykinase [GTP] [Methanosarcinales archaeon ANME-1 ERB6]